MTWGCSAVSRSILLTLRHNLTQELLADTHTVSQATEAYSWGVGEDESGDGLYCGFEGVVGAAVIRV